MHLSALQCIFPRYRITIHIKKSCEYFICGDILNNYLHQASNDLPFEVPCDGRKLSVSSTMCH